MAERKIMKVKWDFIKDKHEWHLYRNGYLYFVFGLGNTEYKADDLFKIEDKHDPQQVLDLVLELIFIMEEETGEYWDEDNGKDELVDCLFSVIAREFGGVR